MNSLHVESLVNLRTGSAIEVKEPAMPFEFSQVTSEKAYSLRRSHIKNFNSSGKHIHGELYNDKGRVEIHQEQPEA